MAPQQFPKLVYRLFVTGHWTGTPDQLADQVTGTGHEGECRGSGDGSAPSQYLFVNGKSLEYRTVNSQAEQNALLPGIWYTDLALTQLAN